MRQRYNAWFGWLALVIFGCTEAAPPSVYKRPDADVTRTAEQDDVLVEDEDIEWRPPSWGEGPLHTFSPDEAEMERAGEIISFELIASFHNHDTPYGFVPGYAYNGITPGPTIRGKVGDTLQVTLTNELLTPTTIHWHGAHVPWEMDGATWNMDPVTPGETFVYSFPLTQAGTFWYHPHFDTDSQVDLGLYGMLIVEEEEEPQLDFDLM